MRSDDPAHRPHHPDGSLAVPTGDSVSIMQRGRHGAGAEAIAAGHADYPTFRHLFRAGGAARGHCGRTLTVDTHGRTGDPKLLQRTVPGQGAESALARQPEEETVRGGGE